MNTSTQLHLKLEQTFLNDTVTYILTDAQCAVYVIEMRRHHLVWPFAVMQKGKQQDMLITKIPPFVTILFAYDSNKRLNINYANRLKSAPIFCYTKFYKLKHMATAHLSNNLYPAFLNMKLHQFALTFCSKTRNCQECLEPFW